MIRSMLLALTASVCLSPCAMAQGVLGPARPAPAYGDLPDWSGGWFRDGGSAPDRCASTNGRYSRNAEIRKNTVTATSRCISSGRQSVPGSLPPAYTPSVWKANTASAASPLSE